MLKEALTPRKEKSETHARGHDVCHGNEMTLMERREAKLSWMQPYYRPHSALITAPPLRYQPMRMSAKMADIRAEETLAYGKFRSRTGGVAGKLFDNARPLQTHFDDRIQAMLQRQKDDEDIATGRNRRKRRWWHRYQDIEAKDPLKTLRFNNLHPSPISELMNTKDVVILQLTGCRLGNEAMTWVSAFMQQSFSLRRLCLQGNDITAEGCQSLHEGIRTCRTLIDIDIGLNPIEDEGCAHIVNALLENIRHSKVYRLNMSTCKLTANGGFHLARLIREFPPIEAIIVCRNTLGANAALASDVDNFENPTSDAAKLLTVARSGAALMLDELPNARGKLKLLDLTANCLTDNEVAAHCSFLESQLRQKRLQELQKRQRVTRLMELRQQIKEKRETAVWDDEKLAVARLEQRALQERQRLAQYKELEQRSKSKKVKEDEAFAAEVERHTGGLELEIEPRPLRLNVSGNHSIREGTMTRLQHHYDLSSFNTALPEFLHRPRRYDSLVAPRRDMGEEFTTREGWETDLDEHNIFTWDVEHDPYDPERDQRRRQAIADYRERERVKAAKAKPVEFNKFKLNVAGDVKSGKLKSTGISVSAGVHARVKDTFSDEDEDELGYAQAARDRERQAEYTGGDVTTTVAKTIVKRADDPIVVIDDGDDYDPTDIPENAIKVFRKRDAKTGNVTVTVEDGGRLTEKERDNLITQAAAMDDNDQNGSGSDVEEGVFRDVVYER